MKKKKLVYEYWFSYVDRNNKIGNIMADCEYQLNSKENILRAYKDLRKVTRENFRAIVCFQMLKRKYVAAEDFDAVK